MLMKFHEDLKRTPEKNVKKREKLNFTLEK